VTTPGPLAELAERVRIEPGRSFVVTIAGAVAVGKSTIAEALAEHLRTSGATVAVVATDGFLLPNAVLEARDLVARKGFPETYDLDRLEAFVEDARSGRSPLEVPVYSHQRYDVVEEPALLERPDVLVVEGVVALQRPIGDLAVYVEADVEDVLAWYVARFQELVVAAADDPSSFYRGWVDLTADEVSELARAVYDGVNRPNLVDHIAPTRGRADVVVHKAPDHEIREVAWREP
jgi:type I pantothenate kinase